MALKIRLRRMGRKKAPTYRIVVAESSSPRDGRFVANLGHYNPRTEPITLVVDREKSLSWIAKGAMPTDTVQTLLRKAGVFSPAPTAVESAVEVVKSTAKRATKSVAGAAGRAAGAVKGAAGAVKDAAVDAKDAVQDAAGAAVETVSEKVADVVEAVRERVAGGDDEVEAPSPETAGASEAADPEADAAAAASEAAEPVAEKPE